MAWLEKVLGRGESREVEEIVEPPKPAKPSRPSLLLLVSDASGMAALRMVTFEESQAACEYVDFWYPNRSAGTLYAIWALPAEPDPRWVAEPEHRGEAVILVRDESKQDVVYPFSFADLDAAWAFLRQEMKKDLDLHRVMIYWAVPIDIELDGLGKVRMSPDAPPSSVATHFESIDVSLDAENSALEAEAELPEVVAEALPEPVAETPVVEPDTTVDPEEVAVADEDETFEAPAVKQPRTKFVYHDKPADASMEAAEELFADDADDLPADIGETKGADEVPEPVQDEEVEPIEAFPELVVEKFGTPFHESEFTEAQASEHKESASSSNNGHGKKNGNGRHAAPPIVDSEEIEIEELIVEPAKSEHEKPDKDEKPVAKDEAPAPEERAEASANGHKSTTDTKAAQTNGHRPHVPRSVPDEISRILDGRKLPQQDGPFKGFNSPRGRF